MISLNCNNTAVGPENAAPFGVRLTTRRGLDSLQRGSGAHGRNGRDPAVDQEVCPDDVRRIVRREVNCQLRDFQRIGHPLAWIVGSEDRSEEHTSELQSPCNLVCRLLLEKKKKIISKRQITSTKSKHISSRHTHPDTNRYVTTNRNREPAILPLDVANPSCTRCHHIQRQS